MHVIAKFYRLQQVNSVCHPLLISAYDMLTLTHSLLEPWGPCSQSMGIPNSWQKRVIWFNTTMGLLVQRLQGFQNLIWNGLKWSYHNGVMLTHSLLEPGGPCSKSIGASKPDREWVIQSYHNWVMIMISQSFATGTWWTLFKVYRCF